MAKRSHLIPAIALLATMLVGCGTSLQGAPVTTRGLTQGQALGASFPAAPKTKEEFIAAAKAKGISFTAEQLALIAAERKAVPNGVWAPRPAEKLTAEQNLDVHWKKHGHEFNPKITSAAAYMAQGNAAGKGERGEVRFFFDTTSFAKGYQSHIVRWVPKTHDFTAFKADGTETTYYQNDPQPSRFIEVPLF